MRIFKFYLITVILVFNINFLFSHDPSTYFGILVGPNIIFNNNSDCKAFATDFNLTFSLLNLSANIVFQKNRLPNYNFFMGIGVANILQFQYSNEFEDKKLRIVSILPLLNKIIDKGYILGYQRNNFYNRINLQLQYEKNFSNNSLTNFGFGISYLIL